MSQVLLGQLRRGVVNQQEHSAFFCLLVARKHYFCAKIKPNFLGERRECGLAQPAEGRPESGRSQSVPIRAYVPKGFANGTQRYALGPAAFRAALRGLGAAALAPLTQAARSALVAGGMVPSARTA